MQLFYHPDIQDTPHNTLFSKEESKHITKVLRKMPGDVLHITNGKGIIYTAEITETSASQCWVKVLSQNFTPPLPYRLHMAVAPTKLNERFEWFLEKATEIGVTEITPLITQRSERQKINQERYQKIIISAAKQSLKSYFPTLHAPQHFEKLIAETTASTCARFIAHCLEMPKEKLFQVIKQPDILILIGPEGDFTPEEVDRANRQGFQSVSLGNSRLRTETAALVAVHTAQLVLDTA